jgi:hypothetical protein
MHIEINGIIGQNINSITKELMKTIYYETNK